MNILGFNTETNNWELLTDGSELEIPCDLTVTDNSKGFVIKSPDGTRFRITVGDDGSLSTLNLDV
jgi:hypothetical protein